MIKSAFGDVLNGDRYIAARTEINVDIRAPLFEGASGNWHGSFLVRTDLSPAPQDLLGKRLLVQFSDGGEAAISVYDSYRAGDGVRLCFHGLGAPPRALLEGY